MPGQLRLELGRIPRFGSRAIVNTKVEGGHIQKKEGTFECINVTTYSLRHLPFPSPPALASSGSKCIEECHHKPILPSGR